MQGEHSEGTITVLEGGGLFRKPAPSGSRAVACVQLFRPALVLPPALPVLSIWGSGRGYQTSVHQTHQLEPACSAILSGDSLCSGRGTEKGLGVRCRYRRPESLCHLVFPRRERGCGIRRDLGLRGSSRLPPPLHSPPSPVPQIHATDADISKHSTAQWGRPGRCAPPARGHSTAVWATVPCIAPGSWMLGLNGSCKRTLSIHVLDGPPLVPMGAFRT